MEHQNHNNHNAAIFENLAAIHQRIDATCRRMGRNKEEVRLMLVTKTVPASVIRTVLEQGEHLIGENLIDELEMKMDELKSPDGPEIHFIGPLQVEEFDRVVRGVDCIQTVDHYSEAFLLNELLRERQQNMDILIQVNTSRRESNFGISPAHAIGLALQIARLDHLQIRGLMTLGMFDCTPDVARSCYSLLRNLYDELKLLKIPGIKMDILSMGMSDHLEIAIEEGSNMIRVGTAIFGDRETPDSFYWQE